MNPADLMHGAMAIADGFGDDPPPQEVAEARAKTCLEGKDGGRCPFNNMGTWIIPMHIGQALHKMREIKLKKKLTVSNEDKLGVCSVCACSLSFKVHYQFQAIFDHTPDHKFLQFPAWCWIFKEYQEHIKTLNPQDK